MSQALIITGRDSTELIERERYWQQAVAIYPGFAAYRRRTDRQIPVMSSPPATPHSVRLRGPRHPNTLRGGGGRI